MRTTAISPGLYALLATIALAAALVVVRALFGLLRSRLDAWRIHAGRAPAARRWILMSARAAGLLHGLTRAAGLAAAATIVYGYATLTLALFPWTRPYSSALRASLAAAVDAAAGRAAALMPSLILMATVVVVGHLAIKAARLLFREVGRGTVRLPGFYPDWADPTFKIARLLILAFAAIVVVHYLPGSGSPAFEGVSLFLGALVTLGSGSAIAHMVAGTVLTYTRAFQVGDRVRVGDAEGDVIEKTLLVTRIRTIKNVDISIPNASVLGHQIVNFSSSADRRGLILHTSVTLGYDVPWRTVHARLTEAALATPHVQADPAPYVLQTALNDFYATYQVNAYTDQPLLSAQIYSELHQNIQDALHQGGIEIMSPHYVAIRDGGGRAVPSKYMPAAVSAAARA